MSLQNNHFCIDSIGSFTMKQPLHSTAFLWLTSIFLMANEASTTAPIALSAPEIDLPLCYMQIPDGRTLDLSPLCGQQPQVIIANQTSDGDILTGWIINQTKKDVHSIKVNYVVVNTDGQVTQKNFVEAEPSTLSPGQTASFKVHVIAGDSKLQATSVDWKN